MTLIHGERGMGHVSVRASDAVAAYRTWEQRNAGTAARLAEDSDRRVAALRTQLQALFEDQ